MTLPAARRPVRRARVLILAVGLGLGLGAAGGCADDTPPDTASVLLAEGRAGAQPWRLEGRRVDGEACTTLGLVGLDEPAVERCGMRRTPLRHLEPVIVPVGDRLLVFSPLSPAARRVRLDGPDGSIRIEPAATAPGFPARFFLLELDVRSPPITVRVFGDGGRAIVT